MPIMQAMVKVQPQAGQVRQLSGDDHARQAHG